MAKKTFVSMCLILGISREVVREITGNSYETIERYIDINKEYTDNEMNKGFQKLKYSHIISDEVKQIILNLNKNQVSKKIIQNSTGYDMKVINSIIKR